MPNSKNYTLIKHNCLICNKELYTFKSQIKKYCSRKCYYKSKLGKSTWNKGLHTGVGKENPFYGKKHSLETKELISKRLKGKIHSKERNLKHSIIMKGRFIGKESSRWKGGIHIKKNEGYVYIYKPRHPNSIGNYIKRNRYVIEQHLGRYLTREEEVHHIDFNKSNDDINNLHLFKNKSEHTKYHWKLKKIINQVLKGD